MSLKLITTATNGKTNRTAKVYRDTEWGEYRVKFYNGGKHQPDADYHTSDQEDAINTARLAMLRELCCKPASQQHAGGHHV